MKKKLVIIAVIVIVILIGGAVAIFHFQSDEKGGIKDETGESNLTYLNKKSPTSEVGDELCSAPLDKYAMICYDIISRNEKELDYIWN